MIITAALRITSDDFPTGELVIPCWRHGQGYKILSILVGTKYPQRAIEEGFIDHKNRFYGRKEALTHAKRCGQLSASTKQFKKERNESELYSEDMY